MEPSLPTERRPQDPRAARHPRPLVEVGHVPVHAQRGNVERDRSRRVRAVCEHGHTAGPAARRDLGERQEQRGLGCDVVGHDHARARADGRRDGGDDLTRVMERERDLDRLRDRAALARHEPGDGRDRAVDIAGDQDLVAGPERERAHHGVHAGRCVIDER